MKPQQVKNGNGASAPALHTSVTLGDVAKAAGVSPATVSRILNGTAVVSSSRKAAVEAAIAKLGFVPNPVARGLAGGRTLSIGVVTQALDSPFYGSTLRGIEEKLLPLGYCPLFVSGQRIAKIETRCLDMLRARRVDGIIVLNGRLTDKALLAYAKSLPIVVTGRKLRAPGLVGLNFDNVEGARIATEHLLQLGHRNIAFISGDPTHTDSTDRLRGYQDALAAEGVAFDPSLVAEGGFYEEGGMRAMGELITRGKRFTAVFSANDQMAWGAVLGLRRHGLRVPEDVSVFGYDDLASSTYANPPLSSVHQSAYEFGQIAADVLLQLLAGRQPEFQVPGPRLVLRESCCAQGA